MSGLYDRLLNQIGDENDKPAGLSPLDIADLPNDQRQVMLWLLRNSAAPTNGVPHAALRDQFEDLKDLKSVLDDLTTNSWLIRLGEPPNDRFKVNLRRKRGSSSLWTSLSNRLADEDSDDQTTGKPGLPVLSDW
jgi:hypothetical protein